jgi:hypothetical protein
MLETGDGFEMTETPNETDERRARAIGNALDYSSAPPFSLGIHEMVARAIRASDEAAGMVLVPRDDLERLADGIAVDYPLSAKSLRATLAASQEKPE